MNGLVTHLKNFDAMDALIVLGQDDTSLVSRIEHRVDGDQLIGFVSPFSSETGLPLVGYFKARSMSLVLETFKKQKKAQSVHAIMAIPLSNKAPPFVLCIYGTDTKITASIVQKR